MPRLAQESVADGGSVTVRCRGRARVVFAVAQAGSTVTAADYVLSLQPDDAEDAGAGRAFVSDASEGSNMQGTLAITATSGGILTVEGAASVAQLRLTLSNYTGDGQLAVTVTAD